MKISKELPVLLLTLLLGVNIVFAQSRPKVGLVLSGGGARGLAHVGILKMIDSLQIPIDYIAATSMGGIVGGLYAAGYSGNEIEKYILSNEWSELFFDSPPRRQVPYLQKKDDGKYQLELGLKGFTPVIPGGLIAGQNVSLRFAGLTSEVEKINDFDKLPIPFRCVSIDLISGKEVILRKGSLAKAMRSTMSIPTVFSPVEWGDSLLIDGGVLNNFPVDVVKQMGADIIIGVNVGTPLKNKEELNSIISIIEQTMVLTDYEKQNNNNKLCDLIIYPELYGHTSADFDKEQIESILNLGNESAVKNKNSLVEIRKRIFGNRNFSSTTEKKTINNIIRKDKTGLPDNSFYALIGIYPGDTLNIVDIKDISSVLKTSAILDSIKTEITDVDSAKIDLSISAIIHHHPFIFRISIEGNEELPFDFIIKLFGIKVGERFDKDLTENQIKYMYGLGYFEEITYSLSPEINNSVHIILKVKEKSLRKLFLGFRYDDYYKIVGIIGLQTTNLPFTGLRGEISFQFAGLIKFDASVFYPSRTLNIPVFPYIRVGYKNIPVNVYNLTSGRKIAEYGDIAWIGAAGIAVNLSNYGLLKFEYNHEYTNILSNFEITNDVVLPVWKDKLRKFRSELVIDMLDNAISPTKGLKIDAELEASYKRLDSDHNYYQLKAELTAYKTFADKHTFRLNGFYTNFKEDLPLYKNPFKGGAESFVGMDINQLSGNNYFYIRLDYIYKHKKDIFLKLIANAGSYNMNEYFNTKTLNSAIYGFGIGVKFLSIVGPFELIFSRGSKSIEEWNKFETRVYFTAGYYF